MLNHVSLGVRDLGASVRFYDAVLGALGYVQVWATQTAVGYGPSGEEDRLALKLRPDRVPAVDPGFHLAFSASSTTDVDAFHRAALDAGGRCDGAPGLRPQYAPDYYAAFVIDPDGHKLEALVSSES